jgi:hypothetical protein
MAELRPVRIGDPLRVLIVAGVPVGVVVVGLGSRLAMLLLRQTSDDSVIGVTSDDGFRIGEVTLTGTLNLIVLGAVVGIIGAAAYQWVRPWLLGPRWFALVTVGLATGAVVGSMLVHADGIDFVILNPTWLAITCFVALPALFGVCIAVVVDRVRRPDSWTARGRTRWVLPLVLVAPFPPAWFVVGSAALVLAFWVVVRESEVVRTASSNRWLGLTMRGLWLLVAVLGLVALIRDIDEIRAIT